jgi:hypothetical protein
MIPNVQTNKNQKRSNSLQDPQIKICTLFQQHKIENKNNIVVYVLVP